VTSVISRAAGVGLPEPTVLGSPTAQLDLGTRTSRTDPYRLAGSPRCRCELHDADPGPTSPPRPTTNDARAGRAFGWASSPSTYKLRVVAAAFTRGSAPAGGTPGRRPV